jgi:3-phosphoshikimate 1-carboxyvinyltransferase
MGETVCNNSLETGILIAYSAAASMAKNIAKRYLVLVMKSLYSQIAGKYKQFDRTEEGKNSFLGLSDNAIQVYQYIFHSFHLFLYLCIKMNYRIFSPARIIGEITLPASKSISNRVLLINALCDKAGSIDNIADCDDTRIMRQALASDGDTVDAGAAGTAMRFLTAYFATREGRKVTIDGSERMRQRPVKILVDALRQLGANITYLANEGFPPISIKGSTLHGTRLSIPGNVSSQYISALLMIAPAIGGMTIEITGEIISHPYIDMTMGLMREFGVNAIQHGNTITIPPAAYKTRDFTVEADWSAASYWFAFQALLPQSRITLKGLSDNSLQGDCHIADYAHEMGVSANWCGRYMDLHSDNVKAKRFTADMTDTPDIAQTLAVALCLSETPFSLTGLQSLKIKETDRIEALRSQLHKLGYVVTADDASMSWNGEKATPSTGPRINTFNDHRMAMSMTLASIKHQGIIINDAQVVTKSYPEFWHDLAAVGFKIEEVS